MVWAKAAPPVPKARVGLFCRNIPTNPLGLGTPRFKRHPTPTTQGGTIVLVLTRKSGEDIIIDGNIRVTVVAISPTKVRIGITAPPYVSVDRLEVHERRNQFAGEQAAPARKVSACP